jgi:hypothetical protein
MPIPYGVYALIPFPPYTFTDNPDTCFDQKYGFTWKGAPATAQMKWAGGFNLDGYARAGRLDSLRSRQAQPEREVLLVPAGDIDRPDVPPAQAGRLRRAAPEFIWESFETPSWKRPPDRFPPTDIGTCH